MKYIIIFLIIALNLNANDFKKYKTECDNNLTTSCMKYGYHITNSNILMAYFSPNWVERLKPIMHLYKWAHQ